MILGHNWYNAQTTRRYPLDDGATGQSDAGEPINDALLADCQLRFPETAGKFAYIGGITVTEKLCTVIFMGADTPDSAANFVPLAVITIVGEVVEDRQYAVTPLYPGVGGWVVFGYGVRTPFMGRYSTARQSFLAPRCARWYRPLPVQSLGKLYRDRALSGLVTVKGGTDVEVVKEAVSIEGRTRDALIVRLKQASQGRNPLQAYLGPCDKRPESGTCDKQGVEFINTTGPDCNGNINIVFRGVTAQQYPNCGPGIVVEHSLGLDEVCAANKPTDQAKYQDQCPPVIEAMTMPLQAEPPEEVSLDSTVSSELVPCGELPYETRFDNDVGEGQEPEFFQVVSGAFLQGNSILGPGYEATDGHTRNIALFYDCGHQTLHRQCGVELTCTRATPRRNGGVIVNYRTMEPLTNPHPEYFFVSLDFNTAQLKVLRFNGNRFVEEYASSQPLPLILFHRYRLEVAITPRPNNRVSIAVILAGVTDSQFQVTRIVVPVARYLPDGGQFGIGSDSAWCHFSHFKLEER